jgi:hypothetical protein
MSNGKPSCAHKSYCKRYLLPSLGCRNSQRIRYVCVLEDHNSQRIRYIGILASHNSQRIMYKPILGYHDSQRFMYIGRLVSHKIIANVILGTLKRART